ncbi:uncharacterized protein N0V89_007317 [Didymosphaeria variabile]|uniref:RING-type domain-containing protein n=1 Tax=Didymosphaeria variabile TaxID=1932322 RepID=A0A9W9CAD2_9PLEO|nr:uncharacterized protein N0V89_007317 [Didymosphaeria variabile]KAJ4351972.1 hypothetical protein N0V89_007317 [Didymosphaeria variabile]
MSQTPFPTFVEFIFNLKEATPPEDWSCFCLEEARAVEGSKSLEVTEIPVQLSCGHVFHLACLYTWTNGKKVNEDLESHNTCPMCRTKLFQGYSNDDRQVYMCNAQISEFYASFFERDWKNRTASAWLTGSLQEMIDGAGGRCTMQDWKPLVSYLVHANTGKDGRFVGNNSICDGEVVPFMCDEHQQHGNLWLKIFLAMRLFREGVTNSWSRTYQWVEFETYFLRIGNQYRVRQALLQQPAADRVAGAIARIVRYDLTE